MSIEDYKSLSKIKDEITILYGKYHWFKSIEVESDDGGHHLELRVTDVDDMLNDGASMSIPEVRLCVISIDKKKKAIAYA